MTISTLLNVTNLLNAKSFLGRIRTRTWVILGGIFLAIAGLFVWITISLFSWLWGQAATGAGLASNALSQVEKFVPNIREQANQLVPELTTQAVTLREQAQRLAPELQNHVEQIIPGLAATKTILMDEAPLKDVSGIDIGPVTRFPGLIRSAFSRQAETITVDYQGKASLDTVIAHYTEGFVAAGFRHDVMSAAAHSEQHKFTDKKSSIILSVERLRSEFLKVQITQN
jgi:hypothetical protein